MTDISELLSNVLNGQDGHQDLLAYLTLEATSAIYDHDLNKAELLFPSIDLYHLHLKLNATDAAGNNASEHKSIACRLAQIDTIAAMLRHTFPQGK